MVICSFESHDARPSGRAQIRLTRVIARCNLGVKTSTARNAAERIRSENEIRQSAGQAAADERAVLNVFMAVLLRIDGLAWCEAEARSLA